MNHQWKMSSLQDLVKYNRYLLIILLFLSALCLTLSIALLSKEDKWVIFPSNNIHNSMEVSTTKLYASYLKPWALDIAREIFTTSPDEVIDQHARIMTISSSNKKLKNFSAKQLEFVKGSSDSSVFYPKEVKIVENGVLVSGTLHYWFAGSDEKISLKKTYLITYKQTSKGLVLLRNIEEQVIEHE